MAYFKASGSPVNPFPIVLGEVKKLKYKELSSVRINL